MNTPKRVGVRVTLGFRLGLGLGLGYTLLDPLLQLGICLVLEIERRAIVAGESQTVKCF